MICIHSWIDLLDQVRFHRQGTEDRSPRQMRHLDINLPCYIFGTGSFGQQTAQALLSQNMQVRAFVSNTDQRNVLDGLPILKWSQIQMTSLLKSYWRSSTESMHSINFILRQSTSFRQRDYAVDFYGQIRSSLAGNIGYQTQSR